MFLSAFVVILSVVCVSGNDVPRNQVQTHTFEVKPGAGRQEYARQSVWAHSTPTFTVSSPPRLTGAPGVHYLA